MDKNGRNLTDNGGTIVYGSNHGVVYAPGGLGVLAGNGTSDVLYYHYCECLMLLLVGEEED